MEGVLEDFCEESVVEEKDVVDVFQKQQQSLESEFGQVYYAILDAMGDFE